MNNSHQQNKEEEKLFFSNFQSGDYDVFADSGYRRILSFFRKEITPDAGCKILDLGCGSGAFTRYLFGLGGRVFALDISCDLMQRSGDKDRIRFSAGDIENLPFGDNTFDVVIFSGVLHHFRALSGPAREAFRVLKKGGKCFAFDPNNKNPIMWILRNKKSPFYSSKGVTPNERLLTAGEVESAFCSAGFSKVQAFAVSGISYRYIHSRIARLFLPLYNFIDYIFSKTSFAYRHGSFLLTFTQK
ncbi:MAG: hypothetical protein COV72_02085 [Candidatus Omnitrophica bacterium CG11_big_fil_rev_8_21_14_0_20_42_13]|uniref:Methyltransferase type 11 domain-containing protein n=1 Tax=Candidatus Ghiorseimicrobium undicola TaxID=1974746 RepID=A0A2H0LZ20_9BACT|nr:MAG: hypothetical protein COV72_02085 [Candidatus Omnitrophica bacterium CG11_big_fil_rev_8_21_14_0_20_42_13]